jgi:hypothetical protein
VHFDARPGFFASANSPIGLASGISRLPPSLIGDTIFFG